MASPAAQGLIERFLSRLERPLLFKLAAGLFLISLFVPDPIPFLDELLFGIVTLLLTRQKAIDAPPAPPPQEQGR
jgi:Family of unknown function (DUF6116)